MKKLRTIDKTKAQELTPALRSRWIVATTQIPLIKEVVASRAAERVRIASNNQRRIEFEIAECEFEDLCCVRARVGDELGRPATIAETVMRLVSRRVAEVETERTK